MKLTNPKTRFNKNIRKLNNHHLSPIIEFTLNNKNCHQGLCDCNGLLMQKSVVISLGAVLRGLSTCQMIKTMV